MVRLTKEDDAGRAQTVARVTIPGRKRYLEYLGILEQVVRDAASVADEGKEDQFLHKPTPLPA